VEGTAGVDCVCGCFLEFREGDDGDAAGDEEGEGGLGCLEDAEEGGGDDEVDFGGEWVALLGGGEGAALGGYAVPGEGWVVDCVVLWLLLDGVLGGG